MARLPIIAAMVLLLMLLMAAPAPAASTPVIERLVLPNGLVVLVSEEHSLPLVVFQMITDAGSRQDPPGKEGLVNLTAQGLLLGTSRYDVTRLNRTLDSLGAGSQKSISIRKA